MLSAFTLLDKTLATTDANYNQSMIMFRNPWGVDNNYNLTWNYNSTKWTADNIAQVPLGVNPVLSQKPDGVVVMPVSQLKTCFGYFFIGHLRDEQGYVRNWFDQENATNKASYTYTWSTNRILDTIYISVENYPLNLVSSACLQPASTDLGVAYVWFSVVHNGLSYSKSWYDYKPYWISIPVTAQNATSPFTITLMYDWASSPSNEFTVSVYSPSMIAPLLNSTGQNNSYFMDGRSPSGFTGNNLYCGFNCTPHAPTPTPTPVNPQTVVVKSLFDVFAKATDIETFFLIIWYNPWVLFLWFSFW